MHAKRALPGTSFRIARQASSPLVKVERSPRIGPGPLRPLISTRLLPLSIFIRLWHGTLSLRLPFPGPKRQTHSLGDNIISPPIPQQALTSALTSIHQGALQRVLGLQWLVDGFPVGMHGEGFACAACQPRKDSWRWQTSNSEYGKFYVSIHREVVKSQEVHNDCSKTCENLSNELQLAKAQLEKLKISCGRSFCNSGGAPGQGMMCCAALPTSPKLGNCQCAWKPGPPSKDMYVTETMNQFNGAQRHDPQMLLDHIKADHPHLVKRVRPKLPLSALKIGSKNHPGDSDQEADAGSCIGKMGCGLGSRAGSGSRSPSSSRSQEHANAGKRKMMAKPARASKKPKGGGSVYVATSDLKHTAAGGANLTPTQRYNFYRLYGYAGQGAKTSKEWHSVKNVWMPTPLPQ